MTPDDLLPTLVFPLVAGLVVGFVVGLITGILATLRWVARRRERGQTVPIYTEDNNPRPGHVPWRGREHLSRLGWVFVVLGMIGLLLGSFSLYRNNTTADCLRSYIEQSSTTNQQRADAAMLDRQGLQAQIAVFREFNSLLIESVKNPPANQEQSRQDFLAKSQNWDTRLGEVDRLFREAEQQRAANPVPPRPNC